MNNKKPFPFRAILGVAAFIVLLFPFQPTQVVKADATTPTSTEHVSFTLNDLGYTSDDEFQGVLVSRQYVVNLPQNWNYSQPATVTVRFSHSPSLNSHSSLAVDWNGTRVGSVLLDPSNVDQGSLQLEIPATSLVAGYNSITLQFYMGISDNFCKDFDNPAVWAVVHNTTSFDLAYSPQQPNLDLHTLPGFLIDPSLIRKNTVTLVLPNQPTASELNAAALVSAKLGQIADWRTLDVKALPLEQFQAQQPAGNVVFIGSAQHLAAQSASLLPPFVGTGDSLQMRDLNGKNITPDSGVLWLQASPNDPASTWLSVTAASDAGLQKAASAFATTSAYDRLSGPLGVILDTPASDAAASAAPDLSYSLADLGYADIVATGMRQQTSYITFPVQLAFNSQGEATFKLIFSHSTQLNPDRSSLDVLVNNVPVTSIDLNSQNAQNAEVDVKIPLRLLKLGDNTLTLTGNIQVNQSTEQSTLYCTDKYYSDSWLTIDSDSTLSFPTGIGQKTASLAGYPALNLGSASLSNLAFVVPDTADWTTTTTVLQVANRLGRTAKGDQLANAVIPASQEAATSQRPYEIVVGLPAQNPVIMQLNDLLPQPFETDMVTPKALTGVANISPTSGSLGYIESLFTKDGQYRLVLTATSNEGLGWVANVLNTPTLYKNFDGNLATLSSRTEIAFFTIQSTTSLVSNQAPTTTSATEGGLSQYPSWVIWLAVIIFVLSLGALLFIRLMRNRK
ncbi:MAG: cellulose biosynthesis cyclic di-GMP-binding regulatory protein BcsB [Anaerolineaceae bacterium]|jgi:hypothetical protein